MTIVLCHRRLQAWEIRVVGSGNRHPVADRVATDDEAAGMDARTSDGALQHLGILDGVALAGVAGELCLLQLRRIFDGIGKIHLRSVGQTVGDGLAESVRLVERQLLHTRHILDGVLGGHTSVGDDMSTVLVAILVHHPAQHLSTTIVVEVGIDIREVHTVGVQETLKQKVVFQGVYLGDSQAIGHHGTCRRATTRTYHHAQFLACRLNKVGHNQEVAWETHGLHHMQLEVDMLIHVCGQWVAIEFLGSLVGKMPQVFRLKLDAVYFVVTAQSVDYLLSLLRRQGVLPVLVAGKFLIKIFLRNPLAQLFLRTEALGDGEERHDGAVVNAVDLHLVEHLKGI